MNLIYKFFSFLFPLSKEDKELLLKLQKLSVSPKTQRKLGVQIVSLLDYGNSTVRKSILKLKYKGSAEFAKIFAQKLKDFLRAEALEKDFWDKEKVVLIPMPMHRKRRKEKSFNQIEILLDNLKRDFLIDKNILKRVKFSATQKDKSKKERIQNVKGAFAAKFKDEYKNAHIFLIDDVASTGATLKEAKSALKKAGYKKIYLIALASKNDF